jgi:hypothetical protein
MENAPLPHDIAHNKTREAVGHKKSPCVGAQRLLSFLTTAGEYARGCVSNIRTAPFQASSPAKKEGFRYEVDQ